MNINRDYLIINDVKKSNVKLDNGSIVFYITDKNTQNIFVNLVINVSNNDLIQKYANIENAEDYTLTMNIVKPGNTYKIIEGKLHDKEKAIFEFDLKEDCVDEVGTYKCELLTKCNINDHEEITTSNKLTYKVKSSVLNDLDEIQEAPEYPLVIQLFDKLSDIEQYEEDRRANELARQLAEEQRQNRFNELDADMVDRITAMDDKMVDVENRVSTKEQAVDKLINDTKADIDEYKVAKDQEIDDYKTAKDTEINNAITTQDNKINEFINERNDRLNAIEAKNTEQDSRLDVAENRLANIGNDITNTMQPIIDGHTARLDAIEAIDVAQNNRLDAIEAKNQQQDDRLLDIEKVNNKQDIDIKCLYGASQTIDVTKEGNSIYLQNSNNGFTIVDEIKGNTLVNCNKEPDKELILNGNINTSADNTVTITEGVDGGLVDVTLEGNTLVNVSKTKDSTAITKAYTVENSGNHIALQGDVDGSCRPVVTGKTLVNLASNSNLWEVGCSGDENIDYTITSTDTQGIVIDKLNDSTRYLYLRKQIDPNLFKPNTTYTIIFNSLKGSDVGIVSGNTAEIVLPLTSCNDGYNIITVTSTDFSTITGTATIYAYLMIHKTYIGTAKASDFIVLEGDYTNKPIPDYFTGLQSSFEDNLVTQEMVDSGEEIADNLGKYKVDYKVTGKNKLNPTNSKVKGYLSDIGGTTQGRFTQYAGADSVSYIYPCLPNTTYTVSHTGNTNTIAEFDKYPINGDAGNIVYNRTLTTSSTTKWLVIYVNSTWTDDDLHAQVEYGDTATSYEPYKEHTKTLYLNSPLLEGDTIEEKDGSIYHVHRSEKVILDGNPAPWGKTWWESTSGTTDTVFSGGLSLAPYRGIGYCDKLPVVASSNLGSYDTAITIDGESIIRVKVPKTLLSDNKDLQAFRVWLNANPITLVGKLKIPTYELIEQSNLIIPSYANGHLDFNTAVPLEKVEFKSFSEELVYLYPSTSYTVQFISTRAILADYYLGGTLLLSQSIVAGLNRISITTPSELVDNKLTINGNDTGANISEVVVTDTDKEFGYFEGMKSVGEGKELQVISINSERRLVNTQRLTHEPLRAVGDVKDRYVLIDGKWYIERNCAEVVFDGSNDENWNALSDLDLEKTKVFQFRISSPDYSNHYCDKLQTYSGMSLSSRDIEGMYVYNSSLRIRINKSKLLTQNVAGFKQWLQQNPTTVVYQLKAPTYEPIDYNPLEVYSGTTNITTNSVIPTNITVKNHGFNCLLKPSTTYTISSNLGLDTVTTGANIGDSCLRFYDTDTSTVTTMNNVMVLEGDYTTGKPLPSHFSGIESAFEQEYDEEVGKYKVKIRVQNEDASRENYIEFYINEPLRGIGDTKDKVYVKNNKVVVERKCGVREYQDGDFGTYLTDKINTVYPLAEPTYEEVEYNDVKLFIESFKNSTLFYNSNIPVTSKVHYSYSVPIVDTVAQTANVTDEQDQLIIDLATQVAVLEMMTM